MTPFISLLRSQEMNDAVTSAAARVAHVLAATRDILASRVDEARAPAWCHERGWAKFLLELSETELAYCETEGLAFALPALADAPASLLELAAEVRTLSVLPRLDMPSAERREADYRGVSSRKRTQLSRLLGALAPLARSAERIVDVGAGNGHFARLAAEHFARATLGLERDPSRVQSARERASTQSPAARAEFVLVDACREPLTLSPRDLAIGLHACGELGDSLVRAADESGASLALISCCLQKISAATRVPLSPGGVELDRTTLGLSNLTSQAVGIETTLGRNLQARAARYALWRLLRARGLEIPPGAEMRGINRRQALDGLGTLAARALASRGLPGPSPAELAEHEHRARIEFASIRRLSLPRNMLARLVELGVVLDRAMRLCESGFAVRVALAFDRVVTPRNIALLASHDSSALPRVEN